MPELEKPFFSVVIPTYERPDDLKRCLQSLDPNYQFETKAYEIIVSDDSNTNKCKILVEKDFPHVHWGKGKQNGPAGNRNAGVERANGEWIVFLDDDCIAQSGYLLAYANAIDNNPEILVFEGRIFADRPRKTWAEGCPENEHGGMHWTSNLCVSKKVFYELKGFDEDFTVAYEDVDFAYRIRKTKLKTKFIFEACVCHPWRPLDTNKNWKSPNYEIESLFLFLRKHPNSLKEYGNPKIFLRNIIRMITIDLIICTFVLRCRGLNELKRQLIVSIQVLIKLLFYK